MQCPWCEEDMMALWVPAAEERQAPLCPVFECVCGFEFYVSDCEEMQAWVQAVVLGEGEHHD